MAIKHTIRTFKNGKNTTMAVELTKSKAIKYMCRECMGGNASTTAGCTDKHCPLFPFRPGA